MIQTDKPLPVQLPVRGADERFPYTIVDARGVFVANASTTEVREFIVEALNLFHKVKEEMDGWEQIKARTEARRERAALKQIAETPLDPSQQGSQLWYVVKLAEDVLRETDPS